MTQVNLPNDAFLRKEYIEQKIMKIANPALSFLKILPTVPTDSKSVKYKYESVSDSSDTLKQRPRKVTAGSQFAMIDISNLSMDAAILSRTGVQIQIDDDARRFPEGVDEIARAYNRIGFWFVDALNTYIGDKIQAGAGAATTALGSPTVWSAAGATPITDIINMKQDFKKTGYPYRLTDAFFHTTNYYELQKYLKTSDQPYTTGNITTDVNDETMTVPSIGNLTVHEISSGVAEGAVMGLDRNNPCGTFYYAVDQQFKTDIRPEGSIFNVHQWLDNETHNMNIQVWVDWTVAIKEPYAALYSASKI